MSKDTGKRLRELDDQTQALVTQAVEALGNAYAPYSGFRVAAAVLLEDGTVVTGTNQENAAYPAGMCAERVALFAIAAAHPGATIRRVVVIARPSGAANLSPVTPCGSCRQVMLEFESRQKVPFEVVLQVAEDQWIVLPSVAPLLPWSFSGTAFTPRPSEH